MTIFIFWVNYSFKT